MPDNRNQAPQRAGDEDRIETLVLSIPRGNQCELRLLRVIDRGRPSLLMRAWVLDPGGLWIPSRRGISIRAKELKFVAEALLEALAWADDTERGRR